MCVCVKEIEKPYLKVCLQCRMCICKVPEQRRGPGRHQRSARKPYFTGELLIHTHTHARARTHTRAQADVHSKIPNCRYFKSSKLETLIMVTQLLVARFLLFSTRSDTHTHTHTNVFPFLLLLWFLARLISILLRTTKKDKLWRRR